MSKEGKKSTSIRVRGNIKAQVNEDKIQLRKAEYGKRTKKIEIK